MSEMNAQCCTEADSVAMEARADDQIISRPICNSDDGSGNCSQTTETTCPLCGHAVERYGLCGQGQLRKPPWLPSGLKFDPTDPEILKFLEAKVMKDGIRLHPLINLFIETLESDSGICCAHPEKLPGVTRDGEARHFFHRPSKAYPTGTRIRRKVHAGDSTEGGTRWRKTGKTRPIIVGGKTLGFKKIFVFHMNCRRQRKPKKAHWVMHQYNLGDREDEKEGELVVSKVLYQTQPRQRGNTRNCDDKETQAGTEGVLSPYWTGLALDPITRL